MKKGDMVYVNSPWGRFGPYKVKDIERRITLNLPVLVIDNEEVLIDPAWCEPVEPELEKGRFVYYWNEGESACARRTAVDYSSDMSERYDHIKPVHHRWDELSEEQQYQWLASAPEVIYRFAYKLITGEEHP